MSVSSLNSVAGGSPNSSLGAPTTIANGTINFGAATTTGTLIYTGAGETTDRVVNLAGTSGGGTIDQSGTGLLKFTSALTATGVGSKTLTLQGSTAGTGEINGAIVNGAGTTAVTKTGTGKWTLSGASTYTGPTNVNGGELAVSGSISGSTTVTVANTATLSGTGTITTDTGGLIAQSGSTLNPGASPSGNGLTVNALTTATLDLQVGSTLSLSLANTNGGGQPLNSDYAKLTLGSGVSATLGGQLITNGYANNTTDLFVIIVRSGGAPISTQFSNASSLIAGSTYAYFAGAGFAPNGGNWEINYQFDQTLWNASTQTQADFEALTGGTSVALLAVPEPNSWSMLAGSLGMALGLQRFRRRRS